jgi:hypothetical protein
MSTTNTLSIDTGFIDNPFASVLLRVPSCADIAVNPAHRDRFQDIETPVVDSHAVAERLISDDASAIEPDRVCYCEKIRSVLALTQNECVFESIRERLHEHVGWTAAFAFRLNQQTDARTYTIDTVFARHALPERRNLLEVRHAGLGGLTVQARRNGQGEFCAKILFSEIQLGKAICAKVSLASTYTEFERLIEEAIDIVQCSPEHVLKARDRALQQLQKIDGLDYDPVRVFVTGLFDPAQFKGDHKSLVRQLINVRDRVNDAPFLMQCVVPQLEDVVRVYLPRTWPIFTAKGGMVAPSRYRETAAGGKADALLPEREANNLRKAFNTAAFERLMPSLLQSCKGMYVAIHEGRVVGQDVDAATLLRRAGREFKPAHLLIRKVTSEKGEPCGTFESPLTDRDI